MIASWTPFGSQARIIQTLAYTADPPTRHRGTISIDEVVDIDIGPSSCRVSMFVPHDPRLLSHGCGLSPGMGIGSPLLVGRMRETGAGRGRGRREGTQCRTQRGITVWMCGCGWVWWRWGRQGHGDDGSEGIPHEKTDFGYPKQQSGLKNLLSIYTPFQTSLQPVHHHDPG